MSLELTQPCLLESTQQIRVKWCPEQLASPWTPRPLAKPRARPFHSVYREPPETYKGPERSWAPKPGLRCAGRTGCVGRRPLIRPLPRIWITGDYGCSVSGSDDIAGKTPVKLSLPPLPDSPSQETGRIQPQVGDTFGVFSEAIFSFAMGHRGPRCCGRCTDTPGLPLRASGGRGPGGRGDVLCAVCASDHTDSAGLLERTTFCWRSNFSFSWPRRQSSLSTHPQHIGGQGFFQ